MELISDNPPVSVADIVNAIRNEMAFTLKDVVLRRTGMGMLKFPSNGNIKAVASIMAKELGWDEERKSMEINELLKVYSPLKSIEKNGINQ